MIGPEVGQCAVMLQSDWSKVGQCVVMLQSDWSIVQLPRLCSSIQLPAWQQDEPNQQVLHLVNERSHWTAPQPIND